MTLSHKILLGQISLHVIALILSLCLTIPLIIHQIRFDLNCILFSKGDWQEDDGLLNIEFASKFYCIFPILTGCSIFILSSLQIYRLTVLYRKEEESSFLALFLDSFISIICCSMVLTSAVFITLGFIGFCSMMTARFPSCETADGQNITKSDIKIRTNGFYNEMGMAQFGSWATFATFATISTFAILKLVNNHQLRNLRVSMYLERQRLVNEENFHTGFSEPVVRQDNMD